MTLIRSKLLISSAAAALIVASPVLSQTTEPQSTGSGSGNSASGGDPNTPAATGSDIIVTAQKREQTLIDVPQSVSVISGASLERQNATTFQDYLKLVPGLQLNQSTAGAGRLVIRGLNTGGVASTVAVYQDETPFGSSSGLANGAVLAGDFDTFDVARIEVLRGPQGTLYGASSLGGVLKFVTNAPETDRFIGRARGGIETVEGGDLSYFGNAMVNVPLGDTLAFRASGSYRDNGGFIDSIGTGGSRVRDNINGSRIYSGRASLLFKPSDAFSLRLSALAQNIDTDAPTVVESDPTTLRTLYGRPSQSIFVAPFQDVAYRVYNGVADIDLGFANLLSSTSYSTQRQGFRGDATNQLSGTIGFLFQVPAVPATGTPARFLPNELYLAQNTNLKKFTQEVRLSSNKNDVFEWLVGGYYTHEKGQILQRYVTVAPGTLTPITTLPPGTVSILGGGTPIATLPLIATVDLSSRYEEVAGFANGTLHLGERFDVDFGGRYSHNNQTATQALNGLLVGGASTFTQPSRENVFTYSVAPKIKFGKLASLYGRVAKGFRPGGPNALGPGAPDSARSYRSDSVISYEVGFKGETTDRCASIDIAAYHIDWTNIQLLTTITTVAGPFSFNANGGRAKVDGAEFTATVRPTPGLDISFNGAYTNARLTQDAPAAVGGKAGDKLPFTPEFSAGVNGDYRWSLAGATEAYFGGSLRFLSKQPGPLGTTARIPSYEVVDLRAGLDFGKFGVQAYARNVNNSDGRTSVGTAGPYPAPALGTGVIRPRSFGFAITAKY